MFKQMIEENNFEKKNTSNFWFNVQYKNLMALSKLISFLWLRAVLNFTKRGTSSPHPPTPTPTLNGVSYSICTNTAMINDFLPISL